jgi:hypothetical protein
VSDDLYEFEDGDQAADGDQAVVDAGPAPATPDRRALLQALADGDGEFAAMARLAIESYDAREAAAAVTAARLQMAADLTPRTIAEIVENLDRQKALGLDADPDELQAAVQDLADLQDSLRAEVEEQAARDLEAQLAGIRQYSLDAGNGEEQAEAEVQRFIADYEAMAGIEAATGGDLLDQSERWNSYLEESDKLKREQAVIEQMGMDAMGYEASVVSAAQDEMDAILLARSGATVGF